MLLVDVTPPNNIWLQLGLGGAAILVMLILGRELIQQVFKKDKNGSYNGNGSMQYRPKSVDEALKQQLDANVRPYLERLCVAQEQMAQTQRDLVDEKIEQTKILIKLAAVLESVERQQQNQATKSELTALSYRIKNAKGASA